jgi:hypothetical protein
MSELAPMFARGDLVRLTFAGRTVDAFVAIASENGASLGLMFEANLGGYLGFMPLLWDGDTYRELFFEKRAARVEHAQ